MSFSAFLAMGGYAAYVWPAYGASLAGLAGAVIWTLAGWRRARAELELLESLRDESR
jgi:heme exporter protein D